MSQLPLPPSSSSRRGPVRLQREFYRRDAATVARELLGHTLVHQVGDVRLSGIITETEAYLGVIDKASHSYNGRRTRRTETMYADGGTVYVFLNYGIHHLFNVVVCERNEPQAVLIRALEPTAGLDAMFARRPRARRVDQLCSGPGKLGAAMALDLTHDGKDLVLSETLYIERPREPIARDPLIVASPRIGVDYAAEWAEKPLRFQLAVQSSWTP